MKNRLKSLVKYVEQTDNIIDIGCDHALLDIFLIKNNIINNVIVSDISNKVLEQARYNINKYNLNSYIDIRCGDGLNVLNNKDKVDTVIISGLGTCTILKILSGNYLDNIQKLIIQSNNNYYELRSSIVKLGFFIDLEEVILSAGKIYINIIFKRGNKKYNIKELKYGNNSMINKNIYYEYLINKYNNILKKHNDELIKQEIKNLKILIEK